MTKTVKTICGLCATNDCGINVHTKNGKILRISGMKEHPLNKGTLCPRGLSAARLTTDPARLKYPLMRTGKRGAGKWKRISWDEALTVIAEKFSEIRDRRGPEAVAAFKSSGGGWTSNWIFLQRFMHAFGSPNLATNSNICFGPRASSYIYTYGGIPEPDFENARCLLLWGFNPAETYLPNYGRRFMLAKERGAKVIVIDPRFSHTASKADVYTSIRAGTDGALALGIAHVIIREELYDKSFIEKYTHGFSDFVKLTEKYTPKTVETITGVQEETITKIARIYASTKPAALRDGDGVDQASNAVQTARAIQILPILTGNVARKGGQVLIPNLPWPDLPLRKRFLEELEPRCVSKHTMFHRVWSLTYPDLFDAILSGEPYPIEALLVAGAALTALAQPQRIFAAFRNLKFIVVSDLFMTSAAQMADIVVPAASFLECTRLRLTRYRPNAHSQHIALQNKVVNPVGRSKSDEDFILELARRLGLQQYFPWQDMEAQIDESVEPLGVTIADLKKHPEGIMWTYPDKELYLDHEEYAQRGFNTPTKKLEIYSTTFEKNGYEPLPSYQEPLESHVSRPELQEEYPLVACAGIKSILYTHTQTHTFPLLKEIMPEPWVVINPLTATTLGIRDGDMVTVRSPRGRIKLRAKVNEEAVRPDTVFMPYGWGEPYTGKFPIVNIIAPDTPRCPISSSTANHAFLCSVRKG